MVNGGPWTYPDPSACITLITNGCTDPTAFNYGGPASPSFIDDGSCYPVIYGCTDANANNFIPLVNDVNIDVNTDDGSCVYTCGTVNISINSNTTIDYAISNTANPLYDQVTWTFYYPGGGSITGSSFQTYSISNASILSVGSGVYSITATFSDSNGVMPDCTEIASVSVLHDCMDSTSCAFNPLANIHNSSFCTIPVVGCMDPNASNYQSIYDQDCIGVCGGLDTSCCCYAANCTQPNIINFAIDNFFNGNNIANNSFDVAIADTNPCGGSYGYEVTYKWGNWSWVTPFQIPAGVSNYTVETPSGPITASGNYTALYPLIFDTPPRLYEFKFRTVCDNTGATGPWSNTVDHLII